MTLWVFISCIYGCDPLFIIGYAEILMHICCYYLIFTDMIKELISRGQQLDAVHFTYEIGLVNKFLPVPLLKAFLKDARKAAASILEDPNAVGRAGQR